MPEDTTRRNFLRGAAAAGILAAEGLPTSAAEPHHDADADHFSVGAAADRGKLVAGFRKAGAAPISVVTPDLDKLPFEMVNGVKEFHLHAMPTRREFLPGAWMDVWGYNDLCPGPTLEATEGDRIRIVVHNMLPESTTLHCHGLELPNRFDGVHGVTQEPIPPGGKYIYELDLHQNGTFIYHSHGPMQEALGMAGMFIIHPKEAYQPAVDHDFALMIQEWAIMPQNSIPNPTSMEFNWFTLNGRSAPFITPLLVRLGSRVRIRFVNMSPIDHHPMHLHGHTWWVTGGDGGRYPESSWQPANTTLVAVAQSRDVEFVANNPGDWVLHCHMFHHMMNHMAVMVGPMAMQMRGMQAGSNAQSGMGMTQGGAALSKENGASIGRAMGEQTSNERAMMTGMKDLKGTGGMKDMPGMNMSGMDMSGKRVPGYPADMMDMHGMYSPAEIKKLNKPETRGMRRNWFEGVEALHTIVRVLPAELYDKVVSGKGEVAPGASVPGGGEGEMPGMPGMHHH